MPNPLDLDALAAACAAVETAKARNYARFGGHADWDLEHRGGDVAILWLCLPDAHAVMALCDAAPDLIAELAELRAYKEKREKEDHEVCLNCASYPDQDYPMGACHVLGRLVQADETCAYWRAKA